MRLLVHSLRTAVPVAAAVAALLAAPASAQTCKVPGAKPFRATIDFQEQQVGTSCADLGLQGLFLLELRGRGSANQNLGSVGASSRNCVVPTPTGALNFFGPKFVLTAANGDQIYASYSGTAAPALTAPSGGGLYNLGGSFKISGGTGRYQFANGCGTLSGSEIVSANSSGISGFGRISLQGVLSLGPKAGGNDGDDADDGNDD